MRLWRVVILLVVLLAPPCYGGRTLLVLSWNLRPYWEFVEGFRKVSRARAVVVGEGGFSLAGTEVVVPLGHRALAYVMGRKHPAVFAALVVAPDMVPRDPDLKGGLFLRLPPQVFLPLLRERLSGLVPPRFRVGIPYTSPENEDFVREAARMAVLWGLEVKPLPLARGLEDLNLRGVDVVYFVPDPFLEAEEAIENALEMVVLRRKVAVGYNRFFLRRGALLAFVVDYRRAGELSARTLRDCFSRREGCGWHPAPFLVLENEKVRHYLLSSSSRSRDHGP